MNHIRLSSVLFLCVLLQFTSMAQKKTTNSVWTRVEDASGNYGFKDNNGKMVVPFGKYTMIFTEKFRDFAIVIKEGDGMVAINKNQKILFHVFQFDNGPDEASEGLFRIIENGKIGYANNKGQIVIKPKYGCAYPFEKGKAKVSIQCTSKAEGEHSSWQSDKWFHINKQGKRI